MEEKEKNQIPEIGDEELDGAAGGFGDDFNYDYAYCPLQYGACSSQNW